MLGLTMKGFKAMVSASMKEKEMDLSFELFVTLMFLGMADIPIQQNIANQLQKDKSFIVRHINILIEKGLVVREVSKKDKRMKKLLLTPKGIQMLSKGKELKKEVEDQLIAGISQEDLQTFYDVLSKMQANSSVEDELICPCIKTVRDSNSFIPENKKRLKTTIN